MTLYQRATVAFHIIVGPMFTVIEYSDAFSFAIVFLAVSLFVLAINLLNQSARFLGGFALATSLFIWLVVGLSWIFRDF